MQRHAMRASGTASRTGKKDVGIAREPLLLFFFLLRPRYAAHRGERWAGLFTLACPRRNAPLRALFLSLWLLKLEQSKWFLQRVYETTDHTEYDLSKGVACQKRHHFLHQGMASRSNGDHLCANTFEFVALSNWIVKLELDSSLAEILRLFQVGFCV